MLYYALGFFLAGLAAIFMDVMGVAPGAAGVANFALLLALVLMAAKAITLGHHHHHYRRHRHFQPHY